MDRLRKVLLGRLRPISLEDEIAKILAEEINREMEQKLIDMIFMRKPSKPSGGRPTPTRIGTTRT